MPELSSFTANTPNWREQIRKNNVRSRWVLIIFVLIYAAIGLLLDNVFQSSGGALSYSSGAQQSTHTQQLRVSYQTQDNNPFGVKQIPHLHSLPKISSTKRPPTFFERLLALDAFPFSTMIMILIAFASIRYTYAKYDKLMLIGTQSKEVTSNSSEPHEKMLYNTVEEMRLAAGMRWIPKVYIIDADYMNAFASGYSEESAMIAITRGLMEKLTRSELQAVMAHELSHIRHLDIKLTLTVAVLSNLMLIAMDILFRSALHSPRRADGQRSNGFIAAVILLRFLLPAITVLLTLFLSRTREYMADAGSVALMRDNEPMARALLKIHNDHLAHKANYQQAYDSTQHERVRRASYIYDPKPVLFSRAALKTPVNSDGKHTLDKSAYMNISDVMSTHPSLLKRLKAIGFAYQKVGKR